MTTLMMMFLYKMCVRPGCMRLMVMLMIVIVVMIMMMFVAMLMAMVVSAATAVSVIMTMSVLVVMVVIMVMVMTATAAISLAWLLGCTPGPSACFLYHYYIRLHCCDRLLDFRQHRLRILCRKTKLFCSIGDRDVG